MLFVAVLGWNVAGAAGTFFFVDPKVQLVAVFMTQTPGPSRVYYRKLFKQLVYQSIDDEKPQQPRTAKN